MSKRDALIRQLSVVFAEGMTREEALSDATTFVDEAMKLGREQPTVKIGEPYQGPDGRWLMKLLGGSVLSFKDEPEARTFAAQREALWQSGKVATPPRCEIVGDSLRVRDTSGATECVLDLRDVSFVNRLADVGAWVVLKAGGSFVLELPTVADYERVADHVAALRGSK
jgi:hypothetical protein